MRFKVEVRRIQTIEKWVRAADEESALDRVRNEASAPYGLWGGWKTVDMAAEVVDTERVPGFSSPEAAGGPLLLQVKDAAEHLGVSRASMYEMVQRGEIEHVRIGRRMFISREGLNSFIRTHSRIGNRAVE